MFKNNCILPTFIILCNLHLQIIASEINVLQNNNVAKKLKQFSPNLDSNQICSTKNLYVWCIPFDYNKDIEPWKYRAMTNSTLPWYYEFYFHIFDIQEVNDLQQTITLDLYFDTRWFEPRLETNSTAEDWVNEESVKGFISIPLKNLENLWFPDLEIYRMIEYKSQNVVKPMASLKINKMGIFRHNARVKITLSCHMDFKQYPFDSHLCIYKVGSFYNHRETVDCKSTFFYSQENQRSLQYMAKVIKLPNAHHKYVYLEKDWATCGFGIELKRIKVQILFQVYVTTVLLVITSWISFIVHPCCIPGRMGLLVTVFLVMINIFISVKNSSPASNGLNAVDIFLIVSIAEVFVALLEYAVVLKTIWRDMEQVNDTEKDKVKCETKGAEKINRWIETNHNVASTNKLDILSLYLFPISFVIFMVIYFSYYFTSPINL